jgi:hypothetical protein
MARTACLVCLASTANGRNKKALDEVVLVAGTNLEQSIFLILISMMKLFCCMTKLTFDIYEINT